MSSQDFRHPSGAFNLSRTITNVQLENLTKPNHTYMVMNESQIRLVQDKYAECWHFSSEFRIWWSDL